MIDSERVADIVVDDPETKPKHEKAIVGLVDEMISSFNKTWMPASNERKKREAMSYSDETTPANSEKKTETEKKTEQPSK